MIEGFQIIFKQSPIFRQNFSDQVNLIQFIFIAIKLNYHFRIGDIKIGFIGVTRSI